MAGKSAHPNGNSVRPKNWLVPVVLLILKESSSYGYELLQRVSGFGFGEMNPGTLYRTLRYMEESGIVISPWETTNRGPARRMYSITDAGEDYLDFWSSEQLQHQRHLINAFFRVYRGVVDATNGREESRRIGMESGYERRRAS